VPSVTVLCVIIYTSSCRPIRPCIGARDIAVAYVDILLLSCSHSTSTSCLSILFDILNICFVHCNNGFKSYRGAYYACTCSFRLRVYSTYQLGLSCIAAVSVDWLARFIFLCFWHLSCYVNKYRVRQGHGGLSPNNHGTLP